MRIVWPYVVLLALMGCATNPPPHDFLIHHGMSAGEVRAKWGDPLKVIKRDHDKYDELWIYKFNWKTRDDLYFKNGILVRGLNEPSPHSQARPVHGEYCDIRIGMTREQVEFIAGNPAEKITKVGSDFDEVWVYAPHWKFRNYLYFKSGILVRGNPDPKTLFCKG